MTTAHIVFASTEAAPLFEHYQGQINPQAAYVTLDLENGEIDARVDGEIGNSMPVAVWNGVVRRYRIERDLTVDQINDVLEDIKPILQRVLDGSEVVRNESSNLVGRLNQDADAAENEIEMISPLGYDLDKIIITNLAEWLADGGDDCWLPSEGEDIAEYISNFDLDGYIAAEDIEDTLMDMWAKHLYDGDPLPANVAQALIKDGRCNDSAWVGELKACAEGSAPDQVAERPRYDFGYVLIEGVVERVNRGAVQGFDWLTSEYLAAAYAIEAAKEGVEAAPEDTEDTIRAHLEFLSDAGAEFDEDEAVRLAIK